MYRVRWRDYVRAIVQIRWITAGPELRRRIRAGIREINELLQADPFGQGESRDGGRRIAYVDPFWIIFEIDRSNYVVRIVDIGLP